MSRISSETGFLARQSTIYGIGNMLQRVSAFLLLPVYTRFLTTEDYGIKEIVTISTEVVSVLISTAISMALFRIYFQYEEDAQRRQVVSSAYVAVGGFGLVVLGTLIWLSPPLSGWLLDDPELSVYLVLSFGALWFQVQNKISLDYLRARQQAVRVVLFSVARLVMALGLNVWFIVYQGMGVIGVLWSNIITSAFFWLVLSVPIMVRTGWRADWAMLREMVVFGSPLVVSQLGGMVVHLSDRFFIKEMISMAEAGVYSLGYRLGTLPSMFVVEPFNQTWLPRRYEIHKQDDHEQVFGRVFTYFLAALLFSALAVSVFARDLLMVMSDEKFWDAADVIPIIALGNMIFALHYHLNFGLMLVKRTRLIAAINLSNGGLVLLLNWLLIPRFGVYGAAYATVAAFVYKVGLTWFFSRRHYRPRFEGRRLWHLGLTAVAIFVVARALPVPGLWSGIAIHAGLVAAFPLLLLATGFAHDSETAKLRQFARRALRRGPSGGAG
jgi:O-antigen/teichoic acid export membrane protein